MNLGGNPQGPPENWARVSVTKSGDSLKRCSTPNSTPSTVLEEPPLFIPSLFSLLYLRVEIQIEGEAKERRSVTVSRSRTREGS